MKRLMALATAMALLLVTFALLVLAQQGTSETPPAETHPSEPPPAEVVTPFELVLEHPFSLNENATSSSIAMRSSGTSRCSVSIGARG